MNLFDDPKKRALLIQVLALGLVLTVFFLLYLNLQQNLKSQNIATGFGFMSQEAGFAIGEFSIPYQLGDRYSQALLVGLVNTLKVSLLGIVLAIVVGVVMGVARLSSNWLVAQLSRWYVEFVRNIPLLLQLFFWYAVLTEILPNVEDALTPFPGVFLSKRGLDIPFLADEWIKPLLVIALALAVLLVFFYSGWVKRRTEATGKTPLFWPVAIPLLIGLPLGAWLLRGAPTEVTWPVLGHFNFEGGENFSPEFAALLLGLVVYTSAFIAEIVRSGIESVSQGQWEAARALGLRPATTLRLIILPQALRVIIPPLTSQMLNLTKNSSLAVAIAYPDFVLVANTTMNQTGQAIELVALIMIVYLSFSLLTSFFMNWYNSKVALVER